ncbi:hypothetical protein [Pseudomonas sp. RIT-PI-AD]|uniref:hypothetical protein n=1 Tax=Pseudomonas sp. RIT-PI-AD TaxID=3035294 RepID=UPI0021DB3234|nr:hypothetical protein [Pseudomonas sp. RIT-PI-AD]
MTEQQLLALVKRIMQREALPDFLPSRVGALLFEALVRDWDALSEESRQDLLVALGMLAKSFSAEAKAERTTTDILDRLCGTR